MGKDMMELLCLMQQSEELGTVMAVNEKSSRYGLTLTREEVGELVGYRNQTLRKYQRVEFGQSVLERLMEVFCDSQYLDTANYLESLERLTDIFYEFKNLSGDRLTDEELLNFMREQFETVCFGDLDYLEGTCLDRFAEAVRSGYKGYQSDSGRGEYARLSQEERWDPDLYMQALRDLGWE